MKDLDYYESQLQAEGLGELDIDVERRNVNSSMQHIVGKWRRLDVQINSIDPNSAAVMSISPLTAEATATRVTFSDDVQNGHGEGGDDDSDYDDGLHDDESLGDNPWDSLTLGFIATPKEAEIADRARASLTGLDKKGRPAGFSLARKHREPGKVWRERIRKHILGDCSTNDDGPLFSVLLTFLAPYATSDAGNGPLSYKGPQRPDPLTAPVTDEPVRMSPVVDTLGYLPGRSPFQMSRITQNNSDITG